MTNSYFDGSVWCNIDVALRHLELIYKEEAEKFGLSVIEWYVLRALYEQDGQMPSQLAHAVGRPATSFTPILDHIEKQILIKRTQHPADRRAVIIHLTDQGRALEEQIKAGAARIDDTLRRKFMEKEWKSYEAVVVNLQRMSP